MRKIEFANDEYYHIFNRGVDKRKIFSDKYDLQRFFQSMKEFNTLEPIGSIYEKSLLKNQFSNLDTKKIKLVEFVCYCLNPNHYHFILKQITDRGIEKLMHKIGLGYTRYFNEKHKRTGSLFQGTFKAVYIDSNEQLLYTNVYVNLNDKAHRFGNLDTKLMKSSWREYAGENNENFCEKDIILDQFKNTNEYKKYALEALNLILENKDKNKELEGEK
ncbi:MAG: transposase [Candidatus Paceibacterota bacterium]